MPPALSTTSPSWSCAAGRGDRPAPEGTALWQRRRVRYRRVHRGLVATGREPDRIVIDGDPGSGACTIESTWRPAPRSALLLTQLADSEVLATAVWAVAEGRASEAEDALLEADPRASLRVVEGLLADTQTRLESVRGLKGPEREQVIADFADELEGLRQVYERLHGDDDGDEPERGTRSKSTQEEGRRLQASWSDGHVVAWVGGPDEPPGTNDELADRLEALGGPAVGWQLHAGVPLPGGAQAEAVSIPVEDALGWLVAIGGGLDDEADGVGGSVRWLGSIAVAAVRQVALGAVVPVLQSTRRGERALDMAVRWRPALLDNATLDRHVAAMPGTVRVMVKPAVNDRAFVNDVFGAVVHAVVAEAASRLELPAPPPQVRTTNDVAEAVLTRLDGSSFTAPLGAGADVGDRLHKWVRPIINPARPRLVVQLDPPDRGDAWFLRVLGPGPNRALLDVEVALSATKNTQPIAEELARLERLLPELHRPGGLRRGQVYLSTNEAWELLTVTGPSLGAAARAVVPEHKRSVGAHAGPRAQPRGGRVRRARAPALAAQAEAGIASVRRTGRRQRRRRPPVEQRAVGRLVRRRRAHRGRDR